MKQGLGLAIALTLAGCAMVQPVTKGTTLILRTQILAGAQTLAVVNYYDKAAINHLKLELYPVVGGIPQAKVAAQTLLNAQLDNPIVFSNLKANTSYRIQASAYYSADDSQLISIDASSSTDITLTNNDSPTFSILQIKLLDRAFNGQATSSLLINNGGYSPLGTESLEIPKTVVTFAGSTVGYVDAIGTNAKFSTPRGITIAPDGTLYVADCTNHVVRKVFPLGMVTTFAGSHAAGFQNGTGTAASFNQPSAVALDGSGNLYVTEWNNNCVRKITSTGVVTTLAGNGTAGTIDGTGTMAQFNVPMGIVYAPDGFLYVSERDSNRIRKVSTTGVVSVLAGGIGTGDVDGTGTLAKFNSPHCITVNPSGELFVGDIGNNRIRKITSAGVVSTLAGSIAGKQDGTGSAVRFSAPYAIAYAGNGIFYVGDDNQTIRKMDSNGVVTTVLGNGSIGTCDGIGTSASFYNMRGMVVDSFGNIYIADAMNQRIRKIQ